MAKVSKILFCVVIFLWPVITRSQTLGLVLSGGGSKGLSHIGVLKALEENNIPIDYITGTSAGALIGGLYASGWAPLEIEELILSEKFKSMIDGKMEPDYIYFFKQPENDASWVSFKFKADSILFRNIPSNLVTPVALDFEMMSAFAAPEAYAGYNFDSLFIPFRCVASDVSAKKSVLFKKGNLNEAIRASMSYPFYLKPIYVDGKLLFDGGLYNNFPIDAMQKEFAPDVVIGSLVTGNALQPDEDDIFNQLENMIVSKQNFTLDKSRGILLQPNLNGLTTFDFSRIKESIDSGYAVTMAKMDSIKLIIPRRVEKERLMEIRKQYREALQVPEYSEVEIMGVRENQQKYIRKTITRRQKVLNLKALKPRYYKVYTDEKIKFMFPTSQYDSTTKKFKLNLNVKKDKPFEISFGGNISSRPVTTGFIGFKYHLLTRTAYTFNVSSSFGKFYNSGKVSIKIEPAARNHYYLEAEAVIHRWDYFKSSNLFYEDKKPSYLIQREEYAGLNFAHSAGTKGKFILQGRYVQTTDDYYRTDQFTIKDTADRTSVYGGTTAIMYVRNSLNKKQFANTGSYLMVSARFINAFERTIPGNTSTLRDTTERFHNWPVFRLEYQQYFLKRSKIHFGFNTENVFSFQPFYGNYTASILASPMYAPIAETKTLFNANLRAHQYLSAGVQMIASLTKNIDIRAEAYYFQPLNSLQEQADGTTSYSELFLKREIIFTTIGVYHSPVGPVSISVNLYPERPTPVTFMFNFGYLIFNNRAFY